MRIASRMNRNSGYSMFNLIFGIFGSEDGACQKEERGRNVSKIKVVSAWRGTCSLHRGSIAAQTGRNQIHDKQ